MNFRKAEQADFVSILQVYKAAIQDMEEKGIHQWDEIYPSNADIQEDLRREELYVGLTEDGIGSVFTLNTEQNSEYALGCWRYGGARCCVVHRLCVNPALQNKGLGTETMGYLEDVCRRDGFEAVRLDAFSRNPAALRLYEKLGYMKTGEVIFRRGLFYLYEKIL